ncbi:MAG: hypothetical protein IKM71_01880 [Bacteroidaceae bacterium]|nr:hypothetical protein [Bacteroidaceae bacterium]
MLDEIRRDLGFTYKDGVLVLRLDRDMSRVMRGDVERLGADMKKTLRRYGKKGSKQPVV